MNSASTTSETLRTLHELRTIHGDFAGRPIPPEHLEAIIAASVRAANASGRQSYSIVVVEDKAVMKELLGYQGDKALVFCVDFNRLAATMIPRRTWPWARSGPRKGLLTTSTISTPSGAACPARASRATRDVPRTRRN